MTKQTILITGATGKTGFTAAKTLLEKGYSVRAMARKESDTTKKLEILGAEIVYADFQDLASLEKALDGIERAYFVYPPFNGLLKGTANFIVAAKEKGLKTIVNMSQISVYKNHTSPLTNEHWLAEQMLNQTDLNITHIRPTFFSEMLYLINGFNILKEGKMYLGHGDAYHAPITGEDIGRSVTAILDDPERHKGQTYILTGPERLSQYDIAKIASEVLEKDIQYVPITSEQWAEAANESSSIPKSLIKHLTEVSKDYQNGVFDKVTDTVEELTGQKPMTMKTFIEDNKFYFSTEYLQAYAEKMRAI
jgi:uncharacterized protein YbjT (DUF2867 family)